MEREKSIDFIKGLAIWGIVLCHTVQMINNDLLNILSIGQIGCQVFYFFSGYLMLGQIEELFDDKKERMLLLSHRDFLKHKMGGVLIPWYLTIVINYILSFLFEIYLPEIPYKTSRNPVDIICNLLFLNGLVPSANNNVVFGGWFLGTLFIFWILYPVIVFLYDKYGYYLMLAVIILCMGIMLAIGYIRGSNYVQRNTFFYFCFINQLPCILFGSIAYKIDMSNIRRIAYKKDLSIGVLLTGLLIYVFYKRIDHWPCIYPLIVSVITYIFWKNIKRSYNSNKLIVGFFECSGKNSLYIYLIHPLIVWDMQWIVWENTKGVASSIFVIYSLITCIPLVYFSSIVYKKICDRFKHFLQYLKSKYIEANRFK